MSFISFSNQQQQQQQQPSVVSITSTSSTRRGSIHNNNDSTNNNISSGEWTARTETYTDSYNDPFGDQIIITNDDYIESQPIHQPPLIDPFGNNNNSHTRTVIRKLGLKRNSQSNGTIDSKLM
ncbi:hypothetical protein BLA29_001063 [Euroglyphus maynei]|uniref:Uncharacterized protein n=1 Tax=Euroglyphus maynei TaxID=6958 RepID=A0A1Y3AV70_EURMA|nr:hypothetical protein BLA29_001063 [Euroglyphus maynei]